MERDRTTTGSHDRRHEPAVRDRERARAAAYLDLWERHVGLTAIKGPAPPPRRED